MGCDDSGACVNNLQFKVLRQISNGIFDQVPPQIRTALSEAGLVESGTLVTGGASREWLKLTPAGERALNVPFVGLMATLVRPENSYLCVVWDVDPSGTLIQLRLRTGFSFFATLRENGKWKECKGSFGDGGEGTVYFGPTY